MKNILVSAFLFACIPSTYHFTTAEQKNELPVARNVIIITIDGVRWQEIFCGADSALLAQPDYTANPSLAKLLYWEPNVAERRKKLMPFFWNVLARQGQLYGNRNLGSQVNVNNGYALSYPGYNEIFTGTTDASISSNRKIRNPNQNVLEYLNKKKEFKGKVAAFTSWNVFPYIFHEERSGITINSGYENVTVQTGTEEQLNTIQNATIANKQATRYDLLTCIAAKEYLIQHRPRVLYIGLGETDEFAHDQRYDLYLQHLQQVDNMIADLWYWVMTTEGYKDNTALIITTDHGRGSRNGNWASHGSLVRGSSDTWMVVAGPGISPAGEMIDAPPLFQQQLAQTIARLVGENFDPGIPVPPAIRIKTEESLASVTQETPVR